MLAILKTGVAVIWFQKSRFHPKHILFSCHVTKIYNNNGNLLLDGSVGILRPSSETMSSFSVENEVFWATNWLPTKWRVLTQTSLDPQKRDLLSQNLQFLLHLVFWVFCIFWLILFTTQITCFDLHNEVYRPKTDIF